ncbi:hypothetical protein [Flammeovirga sp. EKP202]|uniref:hypothetical protein n=1 Tax=Flammeovirga sp. EKP202 TaxID=2770592 RepID=UPI00165F0A46|nr:hypothetical protein [Flammeovirga sp. EKP202]MBD0403295.1 hypothetical protein [Flammeovirga sp. EKP202]
MKIFFLLITFITCITPLIQGQDIQAPPYFLEFMEKNPKKFHLTYHDTGGKLIKWNDEQLSNVNGLVYWLFALEYVRQVENDNFSATERVPLEDIVRFDASSNKMKVWNDYLNKTRKLLNKKVRMREIVSGIINFGNDANGDYMISRLGLDSVMSSVQTFQMYNTTALFPLSSANIYIHNPYQVPHQEFVNHIKNENLNEFRQEVYALFDTLVHDSLGTKVGTFEFAPGRHKEYAALLSDRMPLGLVSDFNILMQKINERTFFKGGMEKEWYKTVEEPLMSSKIMQERYKHCGRFVYSTVNSVVISMYATFQNGKKVHLTATFENLTETEHIDLALSINDFGFSLLENKEYLKQVQDKVNFLRMKK